LDGFAENFVHRSVTVGWQPVFADFVPTIACENPPQKHNIFSKFQII
jgi:hypothetical protein